MKITPKPIPQTFTDSLNSLDKSQMICFYFNCSSGVRSAIYRIHQRSEKRFSTRKMRMHNQDFIEVTRIK